MPQHRKPIDPHDVNNADAGYSVHSQQHALTYDAQPDAVRFRAPFFDNLTPCPWFRPEDGEPDDDDENDYAYT